MRSSGDCRPRKKADGTGGQAEQALGRSRGGFGTKILAAVTGLGLPHTITLSPGQDADISHADGLLAGTPPAVVIADKGYDKQSLVDAIEDRGGEAVIPARKNRTEGREIDRDLYRERNLVGASGRRPSSTAGWPPGTRRQPGTSWRSFM